eukprot:3780281-Prymnesium_polylepis.1
MTSSDLASPDNAGWRAAAGLSGLSSRASRERGPQHRSAICNIPGARTQQPAVRALLASKTFRDAECLSQVDLRPLFSRRPGQKNGMFSAFAPVKKMKNGSHVIVREVDDDNHDEASPNVAVGVAVARKKAKTVSQGDDDELKTVFRIQCGAMLLTWNFKETPRPTLDDFKTFLTDLGAVRTS